MSKMPLKAFSTTTLGFCEWCGKQIETTQCYWRRFCDDKCRNAFNTEAGRLGRKLLKERLELKKQESKKEDLKKQAS